MNDIMGSAAFQEFLQKRCEEITLTDKKCIEITKAILEAEEEFTAALPVEITDKFVRFESLTAELISHIEPLLYLKGVTDHASL